MASDPILFRISPVFKLLRVLGIGTSHRNAENKSPGDKQTNFKYEVWGALNNVADGQIAFRGSLTSRAK
jgi:hypothetical protein